MTDTEIPASLMKYIATRDKKLNDPIFTTPLRDTFMRLLDRGRVEVGGRASCGTRTDPTWLQYVAWREVVKKARSLGYVIDETPVKHANKSPTMAGGFWQSEIYEIKKIV